MNQDLNAFKDRVCGYLLDCMIEALDKGEMTEEESTQSAAFITNNMPTVVDMASAQTLVQNVANQWPIYSPAMQKLAVEQQQVQDAVKIDKIKQELHNISNG